MATGSALCLVSFHRYILSYRNTPDPYTRVSPAKAIFGRQVRNGLPGQLLNHAMARRHIAGWEKWKAHTKDLAQLVQGNDMFL